MYSLLTFRVFLISALAVDAYAEWIIECPNLQFNCFCSLKEGDRPSNVECRGINEEELQSVFNKSKHHRLIKFAIVSSSFTEVNQTMFANVMLNKLAFKFTKIENFHIFEAFSSLGGLKTVILDSVDVKNWIFTPADEIASLRELRHFHLMDCLGDSPNDTKIIPFLPEILETLTIRWCKLSSKDEISLSRFSKLRKLDLRNNNLQFFNRSYLPKPADRLVEISLSYNPIASLAPDMFDGMKKLEIVNLERTFLSNIPYDTFFPILKRLDTLKVALNPIHCDCFNSWLIAEVAITRIQMPTCASPENLKSKKMNTFHPKEMCQPEGYEKTMEEYCDKMKKFENVTG